MSAATEAAVSGAEVVVAVDPERAFEAFTAEIDKWWKKDSPFWMDKDRRLGLRFDRSETSLEPIPFSRPREKEGPDAKRREDEGLLTRLRRRRRCRMRAINSSVPAQDERLEHWVIRLNHPMLYMSLLPHCFLRKAGTHLFAQCSNAPVGNPLLCCALNLHGSFGARGGGFGRQRRHGHRLEARPRAAQGASPAIPAALRQCRRRP